MSTARPVMRTLQYPGRSWWQLGAAGVGDGEKQMSLRDSLGGKMKVWEPHPMPCSCICSSEPTHCSEVSFHILSGSFPDMPGKVIQKPSKCLWRWHDGEYSCQDERDLSIIWTKGKDLVDRERVKYQRGEVSGGVRSPRRRGGVESRTQVKG